VKVTNIRKNIMGTISFNAKFKSMRKEQSFIVYPNPEDKLTIQSDGYFAYVNKQGVVDYAKAQHGVAYTQAQIKGKLKQDTIENMNELINAINKTADKMAGTNGIMYCDNSKAGEF